MTDAEKYAETIAAELTELEAGRIDGEEYDGAPEAVAEYVGSLLLDVEITRSGFTGDVVRVELARTIGGPSCWLTVDGTDGVTVRAAWGSDRGERSVLAPTFAAYVWELAEEGEAWKA